MVCPLRLVGDVTNEWLPDTAMVVIFGFLGDQHPTFLPDTDDVMESQSCRSGR
jgi:hypothetical protein